MVFSTTYCVFVSFAGREALFAVAVPEFHRTLRFSSMEELKFAHVITLFAGDAVKWSKAASGLVTHVVVEEAPSFSISDVLWPLFCPGSSYCILLLMLTNGIWYCSTQSAEKRREEKRREDEAWKKDEDTIGERERVERGGRNQKGKGLGKGFGQEHKGKEEDEKKHTKQIQKDHHTTTWTLSLSWLLDHHGTEV
jgi:hypothetical protein